MCGGNAKALGIFMQMEMIIIPQVPFLLTPVDFIRSNHQPALGNREINGRHVHPDNWSVWTLKIYISTMLGQSTSDFFAFWVSKMKEDNNRIPLGVTV